MNEIIKINNDNKVRGRELHGFLDVGERFTDWMKRMIDYGFTEGIDFGSFSVKSDKPSGGRPATDHLITLEGEALRKLRVENIDLQISPMTAN